MGIELSAVFFSYTVVPIMISLDLNDRSGWIVFFLAGARRWVAGMAGALSGGAVIW